VTGIKVGERGISYKAWALPTEALKNLLDMIWCQRHPEDVAHFERRAGEFVAAMPDWLVVDGLDALDRLRERIVAAHPTAAEAYKTMMAARKWEAEQIAKGNTDEPG
jgi:hypothetical protein